MTKDELEIKVKNWTDQIKQDLQLKNQLTDKALIARCWDRINKRRNQLRAVANNKNLEFPENENIIQMKENHDNKT